MIYGLNMTSLSFHGLEEALTLSRWLVDEAGLQSIELSFAGNPYGRRGPELFPWEIDYEKNLLLSEFLDFFEIRGSHLPFLNLPLICRNPRIERESMYQLKLGIEKSSELDLDYVVAHLTGRPESAPENVLWQAFKDVTLQLLDYAKNHGITLTLENVDFLHPLHKLSRIVREVSDLRLKITFDIGHAHIPIEEVEPYREYGNVIEYIRSEGDLFGNVHAHDYNGEMDHLPIGMGKIDFKGIIKSLKRVGYQGPINFEFGPRRTRELTRNMENLLSNETVSKLGLMVHYIAESVKILRLYESD